MKKACLVVGALIVLAFAAAYLIVTRETGSDAQQITALIERGRQAVERRSVADAMSCISRDYADEAGLNQDRIRALVSGAFRSSARYVVTVGRPEITVGGDEAEARLRAVVSLIGSGYDQTLTRNLAIHLRKENARRYLVFPVREWKVTRMDGVGATSGLEP